MEELGKNWLRGQLPSLVRVGERKLIYFTAPQRVLLAVFRIGPRSYK
jgi:hypothetical protein